MNRSRFFRNALPALAAACLATGFAAPLHAQQSTAVAAGRGGQGSGLRVLDVENLDDQAQVESQALEIRVDNGKVSVKRNGKEVPSEQIRIEDGKVVILDENGEALKDLNLFMGDGQGLYRFESFGQGQEWLPQLQILAPDQGPAPSVMLGVTMSQPGKALEKHLRLKEGETTMLSGVYEGLAAHEAGLEEFDIITEVNGAGPADAQSIRKVLTDAKAGDTITLTVIHAGKTKDVEVKLQKYDREALSSSKLLGGGAGFHGWSNVAGLPFEYKSIPFIDQNDVFVAPEWGHREFEQLQPRMKELLRKRMKTGQGREEDTNQQLERLDQRMAELEALLEKLVEKQGR